LQVAEIPKAKHKQRFFGTNPVIAQQNPRVLRAVKASNEAKEPNKIPRKGNFI
jgi:hypothetical protein